MEYRLLDFGEGRKLERVGGVLLDRPSPAAEGIPRAHAPEVWRDAIRFQGALGQRGTWPRSAMLPTTWRLAADGFALELRPTEFGHLGMFPEQADNWAWLQRSVRAFVATRQRPLEVLNLFAYTGASTLACATAGAKVTHIDAAESTVAWARHNGAISNLADRPIRWIAEDAMRFVERELKRGNRYDGVILDPPTYGHGPKREVWRIDEHLPRLLSHLAELTHGRLQVLLVSCHSPGYTGQVLREEVRQALGPGIAETIECGPLELVAVDGRRLDCGCMARYCRPS